MQTQLTFFCELDGLSLKKLFENRFVFDDLKTLGASVSLGILDLSDERAEVVRKLNRLGIQVTAWLLLPKEQGYWFNLQNYKEATQRYEDFKEWTSEKKLKWAGIGLDIEPDINELREAFSFKGKIISKVFKRFGNKKMAEEAVLAYKKLAVSIRDDGYFLEAYHFPLILDDRLAGSTALQRLGGLVDIPVDREVLMLYSSFYRPIGHNILWSYAEEAQGIGIGSTGGGVELRGKKEPAPLTWEELSADLRLAWQSGKPVYIFSLEGCVEKHYLPKLITFDWTKAITLPKTAWVDKGRKVLEGFLWLLQRPFVALAGLAGLIGVIVTLRSGKKREKLPKE